MNVQLCLCRRNTSANGPQTLQILHCLSSASSQTEREHRQAANGRWNSLTLFGGTSFLLTDPHCCLCPIQSDGSETLSYALDIQEQAHLIHLQRNRWDPVQFHSPATWKTSSSFTVIMWTYFPKQRLFTAKFCTVPTPHLWQPLRVQSQTQGERTSRTLCLVCFNFATWTNPDLPICQCRRTATTTERWRDLTIPWLRSAHVLASGLRNLRDVLILGGRCLWRNLEEDLWGQCKETLLKKKTSAIEVCTIKISKDTFKAAEIWPRSFRLLGIRLMYGLFKVVQTSCI